MEEDHPENGRGIEPRIEYALVSGRLLVQEGRSVKPLECVLIKPPRGDRRSEVSRRQGAVRRQSAEHLPDLGLDFVDAVAGQQVGGVGCQAVRLGIPCTVSGLRSGFQFRS